MGRRSVPGTEVLLSELELDEAPSVDEPSRTVASGREISSCGDSPIGLADARAGKARARRSFCCWAIADWVRSVLGRWFAFLFAVSFSSSGAYPARSRSTRRMFGFVCSRAILGLRFDGPTRPSFTEAAYLESSSVFFRQRRV